MKKENLTISEIQDLVKKVISEKSEPKKELRDAYEKLKKVRKELKERGKNKHPEFIKFSGKKIRRSI